MMKMVGASFMMTFEDHGLRESLSKSPLTSRSSDVVQIVEVSSADVLVDVDYVIVEASPVSATVETRTAEIELPRFMFMLTVDMETTVEAGKVVVQVDRGQVCEHLVVTVKLVAGAVLTTTD